MIPSIIHFLCTLSLPCCCSNWRWHLPSDNIVWIFLRHTSATPNNSLTPKIKIKFGDKAKKAGNELRIYEIKIKKKRFDTTRQNCKIGENLQQIFVNIFGLFSLLLWFICLTDFDHSFNKYFKSNVRMYNNLSWYYKYFT